MRTTFILNCKKLFCVSNMLPGDPKPRFSLIDSKSQKFLKQYTVHNETKKQATFRLIRFFFTAGYYIGMVPFNLSLRLSESKEQLPCWIIKSSKLQKVRLCKKMLTISININILQVFSFFQFTSMIRTWIPLFIFWKTEVWQMLKSFAHSDSLHPGNYFAILDLVVTCTKLFTFFWITTTKTKSLERMLNLSVSKINPRNIATKGIDNSIQFHFSLCTLSSLSLFLVVNIIKFNGVSQITSFPTFIHQLAVDGRKRLTFDGYIGSSEISPGKVEMLCWTTFEMLLLFSRYIVSSYVNIFYLAMLPLLFTKVVDEFNAFSQFVLYSASIPFQERVQLIQAKLVEVRKFSESVNSVWAKPVLLWTLGYCLFKIFLLRQAALTQSRVFFGVIVFSIVVWAKSLTLYAKIYQKVGLN